MTPIYWEDSSWKQLSLVSDEEVISLSHAKVCVFSDSVLCLRKMKQNPTANSARVEKLSCFKSSSQPRTLGTIDGEPTEFVWNIFPGFTTLQLCNKVQELMSTMGDPSKFKGRIIFMSMFNDLTTMKGNAMLTPTSFQDLQKDSYHDDGHFSDLDQKRIVILRTTNDHEENGTESLN